MLTVAVLGAWAARAEWEVVRRDEALTIEAREGEGGYTEFRATAHCRATPLAMAEAVWRWNERGVEAQMLERRLVVSDAPRERLVFSVVRAPVVAKRESLIRFKRAEEPEGVVQIVFESEAGVRPVGVEEGVRVRVRGLWRFVPDGRGGTMVEHRVVSDPGGGLPPWMVKGAQQELVVSLVREAIARAESR